MNLELDLACVQLAICIHNQDAVSRYEKSRAYGYESQGWKALEGGSYDKRQTAKTGLRGLRRMPRSVCYMGRQTGTKILGGVQ